MNHAQTLYFSHPKGEKRQMIRMMNHLLRKLSFFSGHRTKKYAFNISDNIGFLNTGTQIFVCNVIKLGCVFICDKYYSSISRQI